ncbi:class I tRNA ligase family protein, partial [Staphylococcus aureus]|nr:class I tRNA ligase family protein [Staphylococcus aureus]
DRFVCRITIVKYLKEKALVIKIEDLVHSVCHSERSGDVVEPYLSTQWLVLMEDLAKRSLDNQKTDERIDFYPQRIEHTF